MHFRAQQIAPGKLRIVAALQAFLYARKHGHSLAGPLPFEQRFRNQNVGLGGAKGSLESGECFP
jgi:hypothetical protein